MDEQTIKKQYIEKSNEDVKLLCSYTTRKEGFLDILLSEVVLSSKESKRVLGKIKTHRGNSMSSDPVESFYDTNDYISFSTGFVSFKYSDPLIIKREDYVGGFGVIVPLEKILEYPYLGFSHYSSKGGIKNYNLNKNNIESALHKTRHEEELYEDGYGNLFEVSLDSEFKTKDRSSFGEIISYPRLELNSGVIVAIPESERENIIKGVNKRREEYKLFLDKISGESLEELICKTIDGRDLNYPEQSIEFMGKMIRPFDIDNLPIFWYSHKNLDIALQYLAISESEFESVPFVLATEKVD